MITWLFDKNKKTCPCSAKMLVEMQETAKAKLPLTRKHEPQGQTRTCHLHYTSQVGKLGGGVAVKKISQLFYLRCSHPSSFCQPVTHIIYKAERQTIDLASFLHQLSLTLTRTLRGRT